MGLFIKMEKAFAGTMFYQNYVSKWPPPFNIASFDVCLILLILLSFLCPIIRDIITERRRQKRELRWYQNYQRKTFGKSEEDAPDELDTFDKAVTDAFAREEDDYGEAPGGVLYEAVYGNGEIYGNETGVQEPL